MADRATTGVAADQPALGVIRAHRPGPPSPVGMIAKLARQSTDETAFRARLAWQIAGSWLPAAAITRLVAGVAQRISIGQAIITN